MSCPKEGARVCFVANPAARMLYIDRRATHQLVPEQGECGTVTKISGGKTCMPGPRGGMVYVDWDRSGTFGVFKTDLDKPSRARRR